MSSDFFRTRMGQTFYEATMPSLVRELARLNQNLERLVARREARAKLAEPVPADRAGGAMSRRPTRSSVEPETRRVAIYTRKSTTMGLEQEFNSSTPQRESCLAYIQRQPAGSSSTSATTTAASRARTSTARVHAPDG